VIAMMMRRAYDTDETVTDDSDSDSFGVELPVDTTHVKIETGSSTNSFGTETPSSVRTQWFNHAKVEPPSTYEKTMPVTTEPPTSVVHVKIEPPSDDDDELTPSFGATPYCDDAHMQMFAQFPLPLLSIHEQTHGLDTYQRFHDLFKQNESLKRKLAMYKVINKRLKRRSAIGMVTRSRINFKK
jgi:hypothetical protein